MLYYVVANKDKDGEETWYTNSTLTQFATDRPGKVTNTSERWYDEHNRYHRDGDKPAVVRKTIQGRVLSEEYYCHGKLHREVLAAVVMYDVITGKVIKTQWANDGHPHRDDSRLPTDLYYCNGELARAEWHNKDHKLHRTDGPAVEFYNVSMELRTVQYWINGHNLTTEEWLKATGGTTVKKMTLEEIENELGYKFEIIGE